MTSVLPLQGSEVHAVTKDARLVAIRWDLLEWGVVLDLDVAASEAKSAVMRRVWLAFEGVAEITLAVQRARLPTGIWLTSSLDAESDDEGFSIFSCQALVPVFDGNALSATATSRTLSIRAQAVFGVRSRGAEAPADYGLTFESRQRLCSDLEMLACLSC